MKLKKGVGLLLVAALLISLLGAVFPSGEVLAASLFEIGDRVEVSGVAAPDGLLVRAGPGSAYDMIGGKWGGDRGTVVDGPVNGWHSVHGWLTWYEVKWDAAWYNPDHGVWYDTGWSAEGGFKEPPIIITFIEPDVGTTWATLELYHNFNEFGSGHVQFGYRRTGTATWSYTGWEGASGVAIYEKTVANLDPGTKYEYRAWLTYWVGEWVNRAGLIFEFETQQDTDPAGPVSVATHSATSVGETQATLRGAITDFNNNPSAEIRFWYKPTVGGSWTSTTWATRTSTTTYSQTVYGLAPDTEYEFYAQGRGSIDTTLETGDTLPFKTLPSDPDPAGPVSVATHSATSVGETQATLRGAITDFNNNPSAELRFRYREQGTTPWTYTTWTTRTSTTIYSRIVTDLTPGTDYEFQAEGYGSVDTTMRWGSTEYFTTSTDAGNAPIAHASDISGQETVMYPDEPYTVTAKYFDPDGREDLKHCYLQLRHPGKPLTMMWVQAIDEFWVYAGELGESYLSVAGTSTEIEEGGLQGYELAWTFTIKDTWPELEDAIDFGVQAWDDSDLKSGWEYDDTKASFSLSPPETGHVVLIEPLHISPGIPYFVGDILTATFTVENKGSAAITLDKLLLGGRYNDGELPGGGFPDFSHQTVTIQPGQPHEYEGTLTIQEPGIYRFFIAYYIENPTEAEKQFLDENNWNTSITLDEGLDDSHRTRGLVAWPRFKPPYGGGIKDSSGDVLGVPGTAHSDHDAIVCSVAGTGGVQANAIALGGSIAWADAYFAIGDTWRSSLSGEYRVVAPFSVSGIVSLAEIRTFIFGDCVGSIAFKASLHVYDETAGMLVLQQEEIIFEEKIEWWDYIPFQPPRAVTKAYPGEPYVVQGLLNLEKDHDYTWTFRVSVGVEVRAVLLGYAQANSRLEISLDHVRIEPPLSWIAPPEASPKAVNIKYVAVASPVGLLIVDGEGRSTGFDFDSQQIVNEIPDAWYIGRDATVQLVGIPRPVIGSYRVKVSGIDDGTYGLTTLLFTDDESGIFNGTGIPTSGGVIHQYTFDWDALARGEKGVTVHVDSDGDGEFDRTFTTGSELTGDEFVLKTETAVTIDPETLNLKAPTKWITAYIELPEGYAAQDVDIETVELAYGEEEPLVADWGDLQDGVFMAKFDWATVAGWFAGLHDEAVELTVAGKVDGIEFEGTATIRVIDPPRPPRRGR